MVEGAVVFPSTAAAVSHVRERLTGRGPLVAVFDIDDTLFGRAGKIKPVCDLLTDIAAKGGHVAVVTARPASTRAETIKELEAAGLGPAIRELHLAPARLESTKAIARWKAAVRDAIHERTGRLDLAVGDNLHDIAPVAHRSAGVTAVINGGKGRQLGLLIHDGDG